MQRSAPSDDLAGLEKIRVETRADQVAAQLMRYIEVVGLRPGDRLPGENKLAEEFGVSRPIVREAIRDLAGKGVVEVVNGRGAIIRPIEIGPLQGFFDRATLIGTDETVLELMEVRRGLEMTSAILAARRRTDSDIARLSELVEAMADNIDDDARYVDLDVEFHVHMAKVTGNKMLGLLVESIRGAVWPRRRRALHKAGARGLQPRHELADREVVQRLHEEILQAIADSDERAARKAMNRHFEVAIAGIAADSTAQGEPSTGDLPANPSHSQAEGAPPI